jgi:AcrR family transcriptional regulator
MAVIAPEPGSPPSVATRERIRATAAELYVLRGYEGFSFGDIAEAVGTTRANVHHHFRNKRALMAELIAGFAGDAEARIVAHWTASQQPFEARLAAQVEDLRRFYDRFNKQAGDRNVWSPLARLRLDLAVLGDLASEALERVDRAYDRCLRRAVADVVARGELVAETPVEDVARVLRVTLMSCAPVTQDSGSFREVERLFATIGRMILAAWGAQDTPQPKSRPRASRPQQ